MSVMITVGIIARNEGKNIENTLESILNQNFELRSYEIVVVDGNSTDNTREIARKTLEGSDIQHKILNEADFGFYGHCFARNLVIVNSDQNSKYIAFTDADCIVDKKWISTLYHAIKDTDKTIAGAGGPRLVAKTKNKKELVINTLLTSQIASGGNPAFAIRKTKYAKSIANYNAIYKKDILSKFRYDEKLIMSDDNELNFRLRKSGYNFINVPEAMVWHHETSSIMEFARNMFKYGVNITNTVKKHRNIITINVPITIALILYLILMLPFYYVLGSFVFIPLLLYFLFIISVFIEVSLKTKTIYSLMTFILLPLLHISYGLGVIWNLIHKKRT
ncbi:glycosyltransferase [Methanobacterium sp. SMA-27]|uniref:glycosyltransferase n=1 Tax=Methanobacterium sp. SMA-27 TaxID=1495336 RepID=UPI00064EE0A7|nr:glycosyltransferase [Methanobacterium sp. SMA-27]